MFYLFDSSFILVVIVIGVPILLFAVMTLGPSGHKNAWGPTAESLGWRYERHGAGLPSGAMQLVPQLVQGIISHTAEGIYEGVPLYICELKPFKSNNRFGSPTAVVAFNCAAVGMPVPACVIRPKGMTDGWKAKMGYRFAAVPAPYNQDTAFLLVDEDPTLTDAVAQLPPEFWSDFSQRMTYCMSDGVWLVYLRRDITVVPTAEEMPHLVQRALGCYQLLSKHLHPFTPIGKEKPAYE